MEFCVARKFRSKVKPSRNFDVCYDTTLSFPTAKDYNREMARGIAKATQFDIQPCFQTMFSDTRSRLIWKARCIMPISSPCDHFPIISEENILSGHAISSRRSIYFKQPILRKSPKNLQLDLLALPTMPQPKKHVFHKSVQTDYRDSETQTDAWAHDVVAHQGNLILQLNWLHLESYTSPGLREITQIQRFWQKQAWDAIIPQMELVNKIKRIAMTEALAENDTVTKDLDIEVENQQRLELVADRLIRKFTKQRIELRHRLERFAILLRENKSETVGYLKHKLCRDLRKLGMKHRGVDGKYKSRFFRDVLTEITDKASNLNAPQLRFGDDPSKRPEIEEIRCRHLSEISGLQVLERRVAESGGKASGGLKSFMRPKSQSCKRRMINMGKELVLESVQDGAKNIFLRLGGVAEDEALGAFRTQGLEWTDDDERFHAILAKCVQGRAVQNEFSEKVNDIV